MDISWIFQLILNQYYEPTNANGDIIVSQIGLIGDDIAVRYISLAEELRNLCDHVPRSVAAEYYISWIFQKSF